MVIARVQGNFKGSVEDSTPIIITLGSTPINGNVIVAVISTVEASFRGDYVTVVSITQTNVTWTYQVSCEYQPNSYYNTEIWYGVVGATAGTAININLSGNPWYGAVADACEYSGLLTADFLDKTATNSGLSADAFDTGTTAVTSQDNELWVGATGGWGCDQDDDVPTNAFTQLDGVRENVEGNYQNCISFLEKIVAATDTANTATDPTANSYWAGAIATFKAPLVSVPVMMHHYNRIKKIIQG